MPIAAEGDGVNGARMTRQSGGSTVRSRVPDVYLRAVFTGTRQKSSVWTIGQRLFLADACGHPKRVDHSAGRGIDDGRVSVGVRGRDAGSVRAHRESPEQSRFLAP